MSEPVSEPLDDDLELSRPIAVHPLSEPRDDDLERSHPIVAQPYMVEALIYVADAVTSGLIGSVAYDAVRRLRRGGKQSSREDDAESIAKLATLLYHMEHGGPEVDLASTVCGPGVHDADGWHFAVVAGEASYWVTVPSTKEKYPEVVHIKPA